LYGLRWKTFRGDPEQADVSRGWNPHARIAVVAGRFKTGDGAMRNATGRMLAAALAMVLSTVAVADPAVLPARIAKVAQQYTEAGVYPTMVIVMVDGDRTQVAGFGKLADGRAPDGDTVFEIGSVTKTFTALLLAQSVLAGELTLDTPVATLLPEFKIPSRNGKPITLGLLAEQYSGLPRLPGNLRPADLGDPYADYGRDRLKAFLAGYALPRDPGAAYEYSNLGFGLLGDALAQHAHLSYGELLQRKVLAPLGMRSSGVELTPALRVRLAPGHDERGQPAKHWQLGALEGAGALLSSGADMLSYLQANMVQPKTPQLKTALNAAMVLTHTPRRDIGGGDRIGLAWMIHHTTQGDVVWHNGETGGYSSFVGFADDGRRGVVILTNATGAPQELGFAALLPSAPLPAVHKAIAVPPAQLDAYVGQYMMAPGLTLNVSRRDDQLFAQAVGQSAFPIFASAPDAFFAKVAAITIDFERDAAGKVDALTLHQNGIDRRAPRTDTATAVDGARSVPLDPSVLRGYVGRYTLAPGVELAITMGQGQLYAQLTGQAAYPVYATAVDHFFYTVVDARLDFERDASGRIVALVLHQNGRDLRAPRQQ
jgi:serine-type D-Ala-D-Ala carboxypeptidase/endopeptidase